VHKLEKFSSKFSYSPKEFGWAIFFPAFGECGEVSSLDSVGQAEIVIFIKKSFGDMQTIAHSARSVQAGALPAPPERSALHTSRKKAGARGLRLSSWLCARIKTKNSVQPISCSRFSRSD